MQIDPEFRLLLDSAWQEGVVFELRGGKIIWRAFKTPRQPILRALGRRTADFRRAFGLDEPENRARPN